MAVYLSHRDVASVITMTDAFHAVEGAFLDQSAGAQNSPLRQRMNVGPGVYRSMSGYAESAAAFGTKGGLHEFPFGPGVVKAPVQSLFSAETGDLLAMLWTDLVTEFRTGATGGVSAKYLARTDSDVIGLIGAGRQAAAQLRAVILARRPRVVRVFSRDPERRASFAASMAAELGLTVEAVADARTAVEGAAIVIAATNASAPVFDGDWLSPGAHVISIRSSYAKDIATGRERREIDDTTVRRAGLRAVDSLDQATSQLSPELGSAIEDGSVVELADIVAGRAPGRADDAQITLFKSFGMGSHDVAVADIVHRRARDRGLGVELERPPLS